MQQLTGTRGVINTFLGLQLACLPTSLTVAQNVKYMRYLVDRSIGQKTEPVTIPNRVPAVNFSTTLFSLSIPPPPPASRTRTSYAHIGSIQRGRLKKKTYCSAITQEESSLALSQKSTKKSPRYPIRIDPGTTLRFEKYFNLVRAGIVTNNQL